MICDECTLQDGCIERRGLCRDYIRYMERIEEARRKIGKLNEDYKKAAGRSGSNEGSVQKARARDLCSGDEGGRDPERVRTEACADTGTSEKAEGKREEAEGTTAEKAEEERGILDAGE